MRTSKSYWLILAVASSLTAAGIAMCLFYAKHPFADAWEERPVAVATNAIVSTAEISSYQTAVLLAFRETDPFQRSIAFGNAFTAWFQNDPEAALAWLRQMPRGNEFTQGLFIALPAIAHTDPQRSLALAADLAVTHEQKAVYNLLFAQLAKDSLTTAASWVQFAPPGEARENAIRTVADNWIRQDSTSALAWASDLENSGERSLAMESALTWLASVDPRQTLDLAAQNLEGDALARVLEKGIKQLASADPYAAASAVAELPEGELQKNTAMQIARALAAIDPSDAVSWVQTLPDSAQTAAMNNALDIWLRQDASAAAQYVAQLPSDGLDVVISRFAENYAEKDSAAAIAWAENLPDPEQNAAVISIASGWARQDAAAATEWAVSLPADMSGRAEAMRGAYSYWELSDGNAAETFLNSLSSNDRAAIKPLLAKK